MEFVACAETSPTFRSRGVVETAPGEACSLMTLDEKRFAAAVELVPGPTSARRSGRGDTRKTAAAAVPTISIDVPMERVAHTLETVFHHLRLSPLYLVPAARWRNIFEIVTVALCDDQRWQKIDAESIVEQNTRDPLVAGPGDLHLIRELVRVLLAWPEADPERHGLAVVATGPPLVAQIRPGRGASILLGNGDLARQAGEAANHFLGRAT